MGLRDPRAEDAAACIVCGAVGVGFKCDICGKPICLKCAFLVGRFSEYCPACYNDPKNGGRGE